MELQTYLDQRNMSKYMLSKISGVPKTTVMDICAGRSSLERCSAKTVQQLAVALKCSMEELMLLTPTKVDSKEYLECSLPPFLQESVAAMKSAWQKVEAGEKYLHLDCDYCDLQSNINSAEVNGIISEEQAWYLREKYLKMNRRDNT